MTENLENYNIEPVEVEILEDLEKIYSGRSGSLLEDSKFVLVEAMRLTRSEAGYIVYLSPDEQYIQDSIVFTPPSDKEPRFSPEEYRNYPVNDTVFLKATVEYRKAIMCNDFPTDRNQTIGFLYKNTVFRQMNIPVFNGDKIELVIGLGNKREDYTKEDIYISAILVEAMWNVVQRIRHEETHSRLLAIIEYSNDAIIGCSLDGVVTSWNRGAVKMFGYASDDMIGSNISKLNFTDMPNDFSLILDRITSGQHVINYETVRMTKDEERIDVALTVSPLNNSEGVIAAASIIARNITERKEREKQLKLSEERYRTVFENTGTGSIIISEDAIITEVNREFENLSGYNREEIVGKMTGKDFVVEEDVPKIQNYHRLRRENPELAPRNYEYNLQNRNGSIKNIFVTTGMIPGTKESIASFLDITDIKRLQREIIDVCDRERRDLARNLHDNVLHTLIDLSRMADDIGSDDNMEGHNVTDNIKRMKELINSTITVTESVTKGINPVSSKFNDFFSAVENEVKSIREIYNVACSWNYDSNLTIDNEIIGNNLYFIIHESTLNSVKHGKAKNIDINLLYDNDWVTLSVKDDGVGIKDTAKCNQSIGFQIMNYRASIIGAFLEVYTLIPFFCPQRERDSGVRDFEVAREYFECM